jgi:hypothetical protein
MQYCAGSCHGLEAIPQPTDVHLFLLHKTLVVHWPGKMTFCNVELIEKLFLGQWSIGYLTHGTTRSNGPAHSLDYYDTHAIMCAWYYTSCCIQQTWNWTAKCTSFHTPNCTSLHAPKYTLKYTPDCARLYTASMRDLHSQDAAKLTPSTLPTTPPSTFPSTLPGMLSSTLPIALNGTLPACWTVLSHVSSQDALNHTPEHALQYTPNSTRWHTSSLLDYLLPTKLTKCSQAHSRVHSQMHYKLHSMAHSQPAWLYAPK